MASQGRGSAHRGHDVPVQDPGDLAGAGVRLTGAGQPGGATGHPAARGSAESPRESLRGYKVTPLGRGSARPHIHERRSQKDDPAGAGIRRGLAFPSGGRKRRPRRGGGQPAQAMSTSNPHSAAPQGRGSARAQSHSPASSGSRPAGAGGYPSIPCAGHPVARPHRRSRDEPANPTCHLGQRMTEDERWGNIRWSTNSHCPADNGPSWEHWRRHLRPCHLLPCGRPIHLRDGRHWRGWIRRPRWGGDSPIRHIRLRHLTETAPQRRGFAGVADAEHIPIEGRPGEAGIRPGSGGAPGRGSSCPQTRALPQLAAITALLKRRPERTGPSPAQPHTVGMFREETEKNPQPPFSPRPGESWNPGPIWNINPEGVAPQKRGFADLHPSEPEQVQGGPAGAGVCRARQAHPRPRVG